MRGRGLCHASCACGGKLKDICWQGYQDKGGITEVGNGPAREELRASAVP
jgi:hypothetical protein